MSESGNRQGRAQREGRGRAAGGAVERSFVRGALRRLCPFACCWQERLAWKQHSANARTCSTRVEVTEDFFFKHLLPHSQTGDLVLLCDPRHLAGKAFSRSAVTHVAMCYANPDAGPVEDKELPVVLDTFGGKLPAGTPPFISDEERAGTYLPQHCCRTLLLEGVAGRGEERCSALLDKVDAQARLKLWLHRVDPPDEVMGDGRKCQGEFNEGSGGYQDGCASWAPGVRFARDCMSRLRQRRRKRWERRRCLVYRQLLLPPGYSKRAEAAAQLTAALQRATQVVLGHETAVRKRGAAAATKAAMEAAMGEIAFDASDPDDSSAPHGTALDVGLLQESRDFLAQFAPEILSTIHTICSGDTDAGKHSAATDNDRTAALATARLPTLLQNATRRLGSAAAITDLLDARVSAGQEAKVLSAAREATVLSGGHLSVAQHRAVVRLLYATEGLPFAFEPKAEHRDALGHDNDIDDERLLLEPEVGLTANVYSEERDRSFLDTKGDKAAGAHEKEICDAARAADDEKADEEARSLSGGGSMAHARRRRARAMDGLFWRFCCRCRDGHCCSSSPAQLEERRQRKLAQLRRSKRRQRRILESRARMRHRRAHARARLRLRLLLAQERRHPCVRRMVQICRPSLWPSRRSSSDDQEILKGQLPDSYGGDVGPRKKKTVLKHPPPPQTWGSWTLAGLIARARYRVRDHWFHVLHPAKAAAADLKLAGTLPSHAMSPRSRAANARAKTWQAKQKALVHGSRPGGTGPGAAGAAALAEQRELTRRAEIVAALYQSIGLLRPPVEAEVSDEGLMALERGEGGPAALTPLPGMPAERFLPCDFEAPNFMVCASSFPGEMEASELGISSKPGRLERAGKKLQQLLLPRVLSRRLELWRRRRARSRAVRRGLSAPQPQLEGGAKLGIEFVVYGEQPTPASLPTHQSWFEAEVSQWYKYTNRSAREKARGAQAISQAKRKKAELGGRRSATPANLFSGLQATGVGDDEWEQAEGRATMRDEARRVYMKRESASSLEEWDAGVRRDLGKRRVQRRPKFRPTDRDPRRPIPPRLGGRWGAARIAPGATFILPAGAKPKSIVQTRKHRRASRGLAGLNVRVSCRPTSDWTSAKGVFDHDSSLLFSPEGELVCSSQHAVNLAVADQVASKAIDFAFNRALRIEQKKDTWSAVALGSNGQQPPSAGLGDSADEAVRRDGKGNAVSAVAAVIKADAGGDPGSDEEGLATLAGMSSGEQAANELAAAEVGEHALVHEQKVARKRNFATLKSNVDSAFDSALDTEFCALAGPKLLAASCAGTVRKARAHAPAAKKDRAQRCWWEAPSTAEHSSLLELAAQQRSDSLDAPKPITAQSQLDPLAYMRARARADRRAKRLSGAARREREAATRQLEQQLRDTFEQSNASLVPVSLASIGHAAPAVGREGSAGPVGDTPAAIEAAFASKLKAQRTLQRLRQQGHRTVLMEQEARHVQQGKSRKRSKCRTVPETTTSFQRPVGENVDFQYIGDCSTPADSLVNVPASYQFDQGQAGFFC
jgi:hypothetical protein